MKNTLTLAYLSKDKLRKAIAWGNKSNDSIGYTDQEIKEVFIYALNTIEALEKDLIWLKQHTNAPLA